MRKRSFALLLLSVCLLASCSAAPKSGSGKRDKKNVDYDELRAKEGIMFYMGSSNWGLMYEGNNDITGYSFVIEWNGHVTRSVYYQMTDTLYAETDLNDEDYKTLYEFAERCLKKDPFRNYSEEVYDGSTWCFEYYYSKDEEPFEIYDGYCYEQEELNEIIDMMCSYFPQIEYIPVPVEDIVTVDEFKEWYGLADGEIDDEYIEDYIYFWQIKPRDMKERSCKDELENIIATGNYGALGYSIPYIGVYAQEITDYDYDTLCSILDDARYMYMILDIPDPENNDMRTESMLVDFRKNRVYFDVDEDNFLNSGMCAELTDSAREFLSYDIRLFVGVEEYGESALRDCYYEIYIYNTQYEYIVIDNFSDFRLLKEFDDYWKPICETSFGEEYEHSADETEAVN
ncbi:MAG: hypothetical protein IKH82_02415 [Clostridiales bacterium]|nr:hypothetical protein [Clostridiales bacterium]